MSNTLIPEFIKRKGWKKYKSDFDGCIYGIRASTNEQHMFWEKYHDKYDIKQETGYWYILGEIGGLAVTVSVSFASYNGYKIFFYQGTSSISYFQAIEKFIETVYPYDPINISKLYGSYRLSNSSSFQNVLIEIDYLESIKNK